MKYSQIYEGQWVEPIKLNGFRFACCDCKLVHRIDFRIRGKKVQFRTFRDNRATGQTRRYNFGGKKHGRIN